MHETLMQAFKNYPYFVPFIMLFIGLFILMADSNLIKKIIGLNLIQGSVIVFYILVGYIKKSEPPIFKTDTTLYANPLPHVLMLTAIVVGIATTAVAFAFIYIIYKNYGTINEQKIMYMNLEIFHNKAKNIEETRINRK